MTESDRAAMGELLTQVLSFYGQSVSPFALGVWWQACQGFELAQVRRAMTAHAMDPDRGQWAPKPADIVRQLQGTMADRSLIAWGKVMDAIRRVGAYQSVVFDDGAIHAAIEDMGGWPNTCRTKDSELPFLQRRFCDLHRAYSLRQGNFPARLAGESEQQNRQHGFPVHAVMLIGDPQKAAQVEALGCTGPKTAIAACEAIPSIKLIGRAA